MSSDSESDIEIKTTLSKNTSKKAPSSPSAELLKLPKKMTTKEMIHAALSELKSRKGVSLYAIKKYMVDTYSVDTDKINVYIKKYIKAGVESGAIIQTKGMGASGSFRLAPTKKEEKKKKKLPEKKKEKADKPKKSEKLEKPRKKLEKTKSEKTMKKPETKSTKNQTKEKSEMTKENVKKVTMKKGLKAAEKTPAKKKKSVIKRKSIGSIIKPPKMKPKKRD